jgi:outer membrane receptor for ferrienterochelin and colicins
MPEFRDDPSRNFGISEHADAERWKTAFASLRYGDFTLETTTGHRNKKLPTGIFGTALSDPTSFTVDAFRFVDLSYQHAFSQQQELTARIYQEHYDYYADYLFEGVPRTLNKDSVDSGWWGGEVQYALRLGDKHRLLFGTEYNNYLESNELTYNVDPFELQTDVRTHYKTWAAYGQYDVNLLPSVSLSLGLRYDRLYRGVDSTNPRAALIWTPRSGTTLKLLYGSAFRAPNTYESDSTALGYRVNPSLGPEKIKTYEVALEQQVGKHVRATASAYHYDLNDLISQTNDDRGTPDLSDDLRFFANLSRLKADGVDFELQGKWAKLEGRASYSLQRVRVAPSGAELENSPRHLIKLNLFAPLFGERLGVGWETQYVSSRLSFPNPVTDAVRRVPGYMVSNLTFTAKLPVKGLHLSASLYNLFDQTYFDTPSGDEDPLLGGIRQYGRTYRVKLTYRF